MDDRSLRSLEDLLWLEIEHGKELNEGDRCYYLGHFERAEECYGLARKLKAEIDLIKAEGRSPSTPEVTE